MSSDGKYSIVAAGSYGQKRHRSICERRRSLGREGKRDARCEGVGGVGGVEGVEGVKGIGVERVGGSRKEGLETRR